MRKHLENIWVKTLLKILFFYVTIKLVIILISSVLSSKYFGISALELSASEDLSLNDLHYKIQSNLGQSELSNDIILINSGSLSTDNFRGDLASLLTLLEWYGPKVVAIDHEFKNDTLIPGTKELFYKIETTPNVIVGLKTKGTKSDVLSFPHEKTGIADFPFTNHTVRRYFAYDSTFAAKIAKVYNPDIEIKNNTSDSFVINYIRRGMVQLKLESGDICMDEFLFTKNADHQIPMVQANDILQGNEISQNCLEKVLRNKIVIIGHLGNTCLKDSNNDIEDKHAVPCDSNLLFRQQTMHGAMIHANALENIIDSRLRFKTWSDLKIFIFIREILLIIYLYFLLFTKAGKLLNIVILVLLSFPTLYVVLLLMKNNIYIEMGTTLLQLLIFEELTEILEPYYYSLKEKIVSNKS